MSQFTVMSENSRQKNLKLMEYPRSILSAEDSPAKTLAQRVKELVSLIAKGTLPVPAFGESMPGLFASLSQDGSWQKTCAGYSQSLLPGFGGEDSELFCETWPKWGIVLAGHAMELPMLEHHTNETECLLWPTASVCGNYNRKGASATSGDGLATAVKNWPTPRAREGNSGSYGCASIERNADRNYLDGVVIKKEEKPGNLNADWVELLMGLPIGWTDINVAKEDIESWQGWPAAINIEQYEYEPARVVIGQKNRAKRLKALGNGCVPQQIYLVFAAIREMNK